MNGRRTVCCEGGARYRPLAKLLQTRAESADLSLCPVCPGGLFLCPGGLLLCAALSLQATGAVLRVAQKPGRRHRIPEPQLPVIPPQVQVERVAV